MYLKRKNYGNQWYIRPKKWGTVMGKKTKNKYTEVQEEIKKDLKSIGNK